MMMQFLAQRINGRTYIGHMLQFFVRLSVICNVCIVAKRRVLPENCLKKQIGNGL